MYIFVLATVAYIIYKSSKKQIGKEENPIDRLFETAESTIKNLKDSIKKIHHSIKINHEYNKNKPKSMSKEEALLILGIEKNASQDEVNQAFRKLMLSNHPDKGGSKYIASKIIEARDILINKQKNN
ncbi:DnaJ domain-containing protein [Lyticum sinuosum]|uniref:DNA-like domain protein n=1 Tax=Lyticum sinuosum TaxID=1332059 RepID=A0AAE5AHB3_9RICK|nr:DnaJ domain-containing protein [Lyticum sinuosum]MDZ5760908.1 DNA-like domain protein [Lyticum sinuosum]